MALDFDKFTLSNPFKQSGGDEGGVLSQKKAPAPIDAALKIALGVSTNQGDSNPLDIKAAALVKFDGNVTAQRMLGVIPTTHQVGLGGAIIAAILKHVTPEIQNWMGDLQASNAVHENQPKSYGDSMIASADFDNIRAPSVPRDGGDFGIT